MRIVRSSAAIGLSSLTVLFSACGSDTSSAPPSPQTASPSTASATQAPASKPKPIPPPKPVPPPVPPDPTPPPPEETPTADAADLGSNALAKEEASWAAQDPETQSSYCRDFLNNPAYAWSYSQYDTDLDESEFLSFYTTVCSNL